jgi:DNA adenine methylase
VADTTAPPFAYYGGKTRLAKQIVEHFPPHGHYVEPFAGSLAVLLAKPRAGMETVNDADGDIMTFWRVLRDQPADLMRAAALTPHSRAEHRAAEIRPDDLTDLERARRVWVKLTQGRGGTLRTTGWRHYLNPASSPSTSFPDYLASYVDRMAASAERLIGVSLECRPALELIAAYGQHQDVLLYVDPPYLGSTRSSRQYQVEMSREHEHRELAEALLECRASVVLSGYASPLYDELYAGWHVTRINTTTGQANTRGERTEVLWSNRLPQPTLFSDIEEPSRG